MMGYLNFANSWGLWIAVLPGFLLTIVQSVLIYKRARKTGTALGITKKQWKKVIAVSISTAIGPSLVTAISSLTLLVVLGGPMSLQRLSVVGSAQTELANASTAAATAGAAITGEGMNMSVYATCIWAMTIICMGWPLVTMLFAHRMDDLRKVVSKGNKDAIMVFSVAACTGAYGYLSTDICLDNSDSTMAILTWSLAFLLCYAIGYLAKKNRMEWLKTWGFTIAMFTAFFLALLIRPAL